ncbi:GtrA family protein [Haloimpatiens lingqiaonensis]|uniref:GtrA family protein n=1 Tax=Haloimpatiens lingqiaonensis TaxID=1380675 RepID=UPI0037BFD1B1
MDTKKTFNNLLQFITYALIGGSNELINLGILNFLTYITGIYYNKLILFIFEFISFIAYSINGYFLNKKFTFKVKNSSYFKYASVLGTSAIFNTLLFITLNAHNIFNLSNSLWLNLSKVIASMTIGIITFLVNKFFVFKNRTL